MSIEKFTVTGMTCGHCVASVIREVSKLDGVTKVEIDLPTGVVTVESKQPLLLGAYTAAVKEAGYVVV